MSLRTIRLRRKPGLCTRLRSIATLGTSHPDPPPQGGRESSGPLPPCGGGSGWGVSRARRKTMSGCLALVMIAGCAAKPGATSPSTAPPLAPLRVAAASDLQDVLPGLADRFTEGTRIEVSLTFGASGQLAEQIKAGAPFDVFLSANRTFVEGLAEGGDVRPDSVRPYAVGSLVLAVRGEAAEAVKGLADLSGPAVRKVAIANPESAPYGRAGKQALERAGLWETVGPKVVQSESVRQALQFVETGNADAGFVGLASARAAKVQTVEVDRSLYDPIVQALGVVSRSKRADDAEAFARFVLSEVGQALLVEYGFSRPDDRPVPASNVGAEDKP
jgi:molybdate transport system substrate-binding protein